MTKAMTAGILGGVIIAFVAALLLKERPLRTQAGIEVQPAQAHTE